MKAKPGDLAFLDRDPINRDQRSHYENVMRDCLKRDLKHAFNYAEAALDRCKTMRRSGFDISEELDQAKTTLSSLLIMVDAFRREVA